MQRFLSRPLAEQRSNSYAVLLAQDPFRFIPIHQSVFWCWPRASHQSPELAIHFYAMLLAQEPFRFLPVCANISSSAVHWGLFRNTDPLGLNFRAGPLGPNWCVSPPGQSLTRVSISRKSWEEISQFFLSRAGEMILDFSFSSRFSRTQEKNSLSLLDLWDFLELFSVTSRFSRLWRKISPFTPDCQDSVVPVSLSLPDGNGLF